METERRKSKRRQQKKSNFSQSQSQQMDTESVHDLPIVQQFQQVVPPSVQFEEMKIDQQDEIDFGQSNASQIAPSQFYLKIPNRFALRDFFANKCKLYVPPSRELTTQFSRKILSGEKKLLELDKVNWIQDIPHMKGLSVQRMWNELKKNQDVIQYFPAYSKTRWPSKKYLMNVTSPLFPLLKLIRSSTPFNQIQSSKPSRL